MRNMVEHLTLQTDYFSNDIFGLGVNQPLEETIVISCFANAVYKKQKKDALRRPFTYSLFKNVRTMHYSKAAHV